MGSGPSGVLGPQLEIPPWTLDSATNSPSHTPLQNPSKCTETPLLGLLGPLQQPPWTPGSPTDPPPALTPGCPTYPPSHTGCWGSSESPPADTLHIPHPHLCVCLSFPYGLEVSGIPPTSPRRFYTGPSWAQWARIQEEGQGKEQGPADVQAEARHSGGPTPPRRPPKVIR